MPESILIGIFDEKQFPIFENNDLSAWKALLKSQQESNLFLTCGGSCENETLAMDIGDYTEQEPLIQSGQEVLEPEVRLVQNSFISSWFQASNVLVLSFL